MKCLLINSNRFKHPWPVIPFGLCCVATSVEQAGHQVQVLDLCFTSKPQAAIEQAVHRFLPDVVGISVRNIDNAVGYNTQFLLESTKMEVIEPCKKAFDGPILLGGPALGINGKEILEFFDVPFAVAGDGEEAVVSFLRCLQNGCSPDNTPGLIIKKEDGRIVANPPARQANLDALPLVDPSRYLDLSLYVRYNSPLQIQTKRGCALHCVYCTYNRLEGPRYRLKSPNKVADEIATLVARTGIRTVEFTDSTFNIPLTHAKDVLRALIAKGLTLHLRTMGLNPGAVDEELVALMQEAGFTEVDVGAESGSDRMLRALGKNFTKKDIFRTARLLRQARIPATWYLLLGAPGETLETLQETFDTMDHAVSGWDLINVGVGLRLYNGAPITEEIRKDCPHLAELTKNFLFPAQLPVSRTLDIHTLKDVIKRQALTKPNYFMYDEDERTPLVVLRSAAAMVRIFFPGQPLWRAFVLLRKIQKLTGYAALRRVLYERDTRSRAQWLSGESFMAKDR